MLIVYFYMYFSKCTSAGAILPTQSSARPTTSAQPNNRVLITIIPLAVLLVIAGVFAVAFLIALTAYHKTRKNNETSKTSPNKDSLSNLRATENLATPNPLYDNQEGMKMISYAMLKTFNVQVCMSQYCRSFKLLYHQYQMMMQMLFSYSHTNNRMKELMQLD